jgi:hypothetical protein
MAKQQDDRSRPTTEPSLDKYIGSGIDKLSPEDAALIANFLQNTSQEKFSNIPSFRLN